MCPQQHIKFVQTYITNRLIISNIARGQVIHRLNHTCGGQTWMRNSTPMTFSNPLCHSWMERHPNTIFRNDTARPHRVPVASLSVFGGAQHRANGSLASPGHNGTNHWTVGPTTGKAVNGRPRPWWHPSRPGSAPYRGVETSTGESSLTTMQHAWSMHALHWLAIKVARQDYVFKERKTAKKGINDSIKKERL